MKRLAVFLVGLLLVLTFNAYACVLPIPSVSQTDCSSTTEGPVRQTCDAFLEIGPLSESSSQTPITALTLDFDFSVPTQDSLVPLSTTAPILTPVVIELISRRLHEARPGGERACVKSKRS